MSRLLNQPGRAELMLYSAHIGDNDGVMVFASDVRTALKLALDVEPVYLLSDPLSVVVLEVSLDWLNSHDARSRHTRTALERGEMGVGEYDPQCGWIMLENAA